ncbi:RapZ C-terminal domain-containing protein [Streptomyces subrutilus]|uniref:ATPase n=1 Tax=Streptomyces subrutilus TaxID=36818 RepID=A0A1E5PPV9_9ACTN|nr:RNase adapter RapZ [Streptomyces subrutilus]OEJ31596.1 ATPase [Streptomyces subrutilus]
MNVEIVSFGYLHAAPPAAHLTLDLRSHFRDPHVSPKLRYLTAEDEPVRHAVLATPGIVPLITATLLAVDAFAAGPGGGHLVLATGCQGGRHRAATVALTVAHLLTGAGHKVTLHHRDLHKPVVNR